MPVKPKTGRPPRAKGQPMTRLSVSIQQRHKDALDLIARDRRTSLSQAIEYVIAAVGREYEVDGMSVLAIADAGNQSHGTAIGRLHKITSTPKALQTSNEDFATRMLGDAPDLNSISEEEARLLLEVASDVHVTGGTVEFAVELWRKVCAAWKQGEKSVSIESEHDGMTFEYDFTAIKIKAHPRS